MTISTRMRFEILRRDGFRCRYCGKKAAEVELDVDHVVPRALGGSDAPDNLATACRACNTGKASVSLDSETVDEINEVNLARRDAIAAAIARIVLEETDVDADEEHDHAVQWARAWQSYTFGDGEPLHLPDYHNLRASIRVWLDRGMSVDALIVLIDVAMKANHVPIEERFRYYCGVVWRTIDRALELAGTDQ